MPDVDRSEDGDEYSEHGVGLLTGQQRHFSKPGSKLRGYLAYAATTVLWILSLMLTVKLSSRSCRIDGFASGFDTDLGEPKRP